MPTEVAVDAAGYVASNAVALLFAASTALLLLTAAVWWTIQRIVPVLRQAAGKLGGRLPQGWFTQGQYLGLHTALSFPVAALAVGGFLELTEEIAAQQDLGALDLALSSALSQQLSDRVLGFFATVTVLGDPLFLVPLGIVVAAALVLRRERLLALSWTLTTLGGAALNRVLKSWFARERPVHAHGFASADGWSFPSGHASGSMLVYGLLAYLVVRHTRAAWHLPTVMASLLLIVIVGSSRVLLQVHFLSDVLAGWASSVAWLALCIAGMETALRSSSRGNRAAS